MRKEAKLKYWMVTGKGDDYGACLQELVRTTVENACQYYSHTEVDPSDTEVLFKFFDLVDYEEESSRTNEQRYFGNE